MRKSPAQSAAQPDFAALAATAGAAAATHLRLAPKDFAAKPPTLSEWAEDAYQQHGVPSLEKAADDAGAAVDVDDQGLKARFARAFVSTMKARLKKAPPKSRPAKKMAPKTLEEAAAAAGVLGAREADDDDFRDGIAAADAAEVAEVAAQYYVAHGEEALEAASESLDLPLDGVRGSPQDRALQQAYTRAFAAALARRK